jgi:hypothetical protein
MDEYAKNRMAELQAAAPRKSRIQKQQGQFIKLPVWWLDKLGEAPLATGTTHQVACHLLNLSFKNRRKTFKLPNGVLRGRGISRFMKWRALVDLEQRGLITIERQQRKSPIISVQLRQVSASLQHDPRRICCVLAA